MFRNVKANKPGMGIIERQVDLFYSWCFVGFGWKLSLG